MIKFVIRFAILGILVTTFVTGIEGVSSSAHASSLTKHKLSSYQQPKNCGVYTLRKSTNAKTNEVGYGLILREYKDDCLNIYIDAEGFVPAGEPGGGYLCTGGNCLTTGYGAIHGSYFDVASPTYSGSCGVTLGASGSFTNLNGSSNLVDNFICI